jgi:phage terminase small subunit
MTQVGRTELSGRQCRFCAEYIKNFNGKQAAILAGYSRKTAEVQASRLLRNVKVQREIQAICERAMRKLAIEAESIIAQCIRLAFSNIFDFIRIDSDGFPHIDLSKVDRDATAGIARLKVHPNGAWEIKLVDRVRALEVLTKLLRIEPSKAYDSAVGKYDRGERPEYSLSNEELEERVREFLATR